MARHRLPMRPGLRRLRLCPAAAGLAVFAAALCLAAPEIVRDDPATLTIRNRHLEVRFSDGALRALTDRCTGRALLQWPADTPAWTVEVDHRTLQPPAAASLSPVSHSGLVSVTATSAVAGDDPITGAYRVTLGDDPWAELSIRIENRGRREVEVLTFPSGAFWPTSPGRFLVLPYQSGMILPLDHRFPRILKYGLVPFVEGYPGNLCSMQWFGAYDDAGAVMLLGTDRYGSLKRLGAQPDEAASPGGGRARVVCEHQASLRPGEAFSPAPWRVLALPGGDYRAMCAAYRDWVRERQAPGAAVARDRVGAVEKTPLQFVSWQARLVARPHLARVLTTHGYPEHAVRTGARGEPIPYVPYGLALALVRRFEDIYRSPLTPQLWSPFVEGGGWKLFPHRAFLEDPIVVDGLRFPGLSLPDFLAETDRRGSPIFLYVNPSFWRNGSSDFDIADMFDKDGDGVGDTFGGFEAQASDDSAYVSPLPVRPYLVAQLSRLSGSGPDALGTANGIMFDSSQVFGAGLWWGSRVRGDRISCLDRNPRARYLERYGYFGRDSGVQDKLATYLALHEATPHAAKAGEWIGEFETLFLDVNAGSVCLKREYPDTTPRPPDENVIPVPLFQMVYGDSGVFVIRVGAACDATLAAGKPDEAIPAEVSRRGSALFGAVHQVLYWGGVRWAGLAYNRLRPRTWMVVRDNAARHAIFAGRARFRMLAPAGAETTGLFTVRETSWLDQDGATVGLHWDNNAGRDAAVTGLLDGETVAVSSLWGAPDFLPSSLDRLRAGATLTLLRDGHFAAWAFAGHASRAGRPALAITDSLPTPEGLSVVWDGSYLSVANEQPRDRRVRVEFSAPPGRLVPLPPYQPCRPDGAPIEDAEPLVYNQATQWRAQVRDGRAVLDVTLPAARPEPGDRPLAVPASLAAFQFIPPQA